MHFMMAERQLNITIIFLFLETEGDEIPHVFLGLSYLEYRKKKKNNNYLEIPK